MSVLKSLRLGACAVLMLLVGVAQAAIQVVDPVTGKLKGAMGVDVGGTLYDVSFANGSCISLFSGCTSTTSFAFQSQSSAMLAGHALLDQVFIDTPAGAFDSNPLLTAGIGIFAGIILTPYFVPDPPIPIQGSKNFIDLYAVEVDNNFTSDVIWPSFEHWSGGNYRNTDTGINGSHAYAIWTASVAAVPEPEIYATLLTGLGVLGWIGRRKKLKERAASSHQLTILT